MFFILRNFNTQSDYEVISLSPPYFQRITLVAWCAIRYTAWVIKSFKHKGLQRFYETGSTSGIQPAHRKRLRMQLAALNTATAIKDMAVPGYRLHQLKGERKEIWSISVSGNWRITFRFEEGNVYIANYEDDH